MYVVGVSSKLSNTIFTYKMCFLSFLSPLASIFPPFLPQTRGSLASFWETGTSKHPRSALTILLLWIVDLGCQKSRLHQFLNHLICHISHPSALHSALVSGPGHTQCWLCQQSCCDTFTPLVPQMELDPVLATLPCVVTLVWGAAWNHITE